MAEKPYCFLDVDGVLNTVVPNDQTGTTLTCEGFRICIPKTFKANLERLNDAFDMVWLTTWEHLANKHYNPHFGMDEWPVVEWRVSRGHSDHREDYKLTALIEWMKANGERPFCFIDDDAPFEIAELKNRDWELHEQTEVPHLLLHPDTYEGLTTEQTDAALAFAAENVQ